MANSNLPIAPINVTLDETTTPPTVAVQFPDIEIHQPTRLVWLLTGNAAECCFPPSSDRKHPAFDFLTGSSLLGVFDNPLLCDKQFSLDDHHDVQPNSEWPYHLWLKLGKNLYYQTAPARAKSPNADGQKTKGQTTIGPKITKCPRIKNR